MCLLPLIEGSRGYIHRVISQSGSPMCTRSTEESIVCTDELMELLGCKTVADLQKVEPVKMIEASGSILGLRVFPERDGRYLPENPYDEYANGAGKNIPILQGCNKDEGGYFAFVLGSEAYSAFSADRVGDENLLTL